MQHDVSTTKQRTRCLKRKRRLTDVNIRQFPYSNKLFGFVLTSLSIHNHKVSAQYLWRNNRTLTSQGIVFSLLVTKHLRSPVV